MAEKHANMRFAAPVAIDVQSDPGRMVPKTTLVGPFAERTFVQKRTARNDALLANKYEWSKVPFEESKENYYEEAEPALVCDTDKALANEASKTLLVRITG